MRIVSRLLMNIQLFWLCLMVSCDGMYNRLPGWVVGVSLVLFCATGFVFKFNRLFLGSKPPLWFVFVVSFPFFSIVFFEIFFAVINESLSLSGDIYFRVIWLGVFVLALSYGVWGWINK